MGLSIGCYCEVDIKCVSKLLAAHRNGKDKWLRFKMPARENNFSRTVQRDYLKIDKDFIDVNCLWLYVRPSW